MEGANEEDLGVGVGLECAWGGTADDIECGTGGVLKRTDADPFGNALEEN